MSEPMQTEAGGHEPALFDAVLHPHASLSPRGFVALMAVLCGISFAAGVAFMLMGAWPIFGFFGLDVLLVYVAFRVSYYRARRYETLRLTETCLTVERVAPGGEVQTWTFQPYWLRVETGGHHEPGSRLVLASHGRRLEIGTFLTAAERLDLARALERALEDAKRPRFS